MDKKSCFRSLAGVAAALLVSVVMLVSCGDSRSLRSRLSPVCSVALDSISLPGGADLESRVMEMMSDSVAMADTVAVDIAIDIADALLSAGEYGRLIDLVRDAGDLLDNDDAASRGMKRRILELRSYGYEVYRYMGMYERAGKGMVEDLATAAQLGLKENMALLSNNISTLYKKQGMYDDAIKMALRSVKINEELNDSNFLVVNHNNLASIYLDMRNFGKAVEYSFLALHYIPQTDTLLRMVVQRNVSTKFSHMKEYDMALRQLEPVFDYFEKSGDTREMPFTLACLANIQWKKGNLAEASAYYEKAFGMIDKGSLEQRKEVAGDYARFCNAVGDKANELVAIRKYLDLVREGENAGEEKLSSALRLMYQHEMERGDDNARLGRENRRLLYIWIYVLSFLCLCAFVLVWVIATRNRRHVRAMRSKLDEALRHLHSSAVESTRNRELISRIQRQLLSLQTTLRTAPKSESLDRLRSIASEVMGCGRNDSNVLNVANADFFARLLEKYPDLTSNDLRLASMLRQGMSSKEIAGVVMKETRSIETARNRLRKKMEIPSEVDLCKFFMQL